MLFLMLGASIQASHDQELLNRELLPVSVLLVMQLGACRLVFFIVHWICVFIFLYMFIRGTWWHSWLRNCATSWKDTGSIPCGSLSNFSLTLSFLLHYGPGVDSVSNRNEYQEYFLEGKVGWCIWEPHPPGILGACIRIALPFLHIYFKFDKCSKMQVISSFSSLIFQTLLHNP